MTLIRLRRAAVLAGMVSTVAAASALEAQSLPLDSLFRAHRHAVEYADDAVSGAGFQLLLESAATAQFVMVGESHNVREIPLFTASLFEALHERYGFNYLALEDGPYALEMYGESGTRGDRDASIQLANRYPNALQFWTDQEVELIVRAGAASTVRENPLWGLDQTWGTLHILHRLDDLSRGPEARTAVRRVIAHAEPLEAFRPSEENPRFITDELTQGHLSNLRVHLLDAGPEAVRLLDMLETSLLIYSTRTDGPAIYLSNDRRERYMRSQLMERYRAAREEGDSIPRVVLKFGQWHALKGVLNWGQVHPLGTFVSELAQSHGMGSLHIWTGLVNEPGDFWTLTDYPDYAPLASAGSPDGWCLVDLRAVRPFVAAGQVEEISEDLRKVIFGFDFALLIGSGSRATQEWLFEGWVG